MEQNSELFHSSRSVEVKKKKMAVCQAIWVQKSLSYLVCLSDQKVTPIDSEAKTSKRFMRISMPVWAVGTLDNDVTDEAVREMKLNSNKLLPHAIFFE